MMNILKNDSIWLSDSRFLNDSREIEDGRKATLEAIKAVIEDTNFPYSKDILKSIADHFNSPDLHCFVASFCLDNSLASQWALYAGKGKGCCIEFDVNNPETRRFFTQRPDRPKSLRYFRLYKAIYDSNVKAKFQEDIIRGFYQELYQVANDAHDANKLDQFRGQLIGSLSYSLASYKDPSFRDENEVRLVLDQYHADKEFELKFRAKNNFIIPYVESKGLKKKSECNHRLPTISKVSVAPCAYHDDVLKSIMNLQKLIQKDSEGSHQLIPELPPINRILVAPCAYHEDVLRSIRNFLKLIKKGDIIVKSYNLPYRGE